MVKTCLKTISIYTGNVVKNPKEPKYLSINLGNEAFKKRVGSIRGGVMILRAFGFEENTSENKLVLSNYDPILFQKGNKLLEDELFNTFFQKEHEITEAQKDLKKQLSQISFTHEDEPELEDDFWQGVDDNFDQLMDFDLDNLTMVK